MIPYGRQTISEEDIDAVVAVLKSDFLTQGAIVPAFEQAIADYCDVPHAVACSNGTTALQMACVALNICSEDLVWISAVSFVASANCARYCGAEVDFIDVEPETGDLSVNALQDKLIQANQLGRMPKALVVVHLAGQPCDMTEIAALCRQHGIAIIEDACHALGAHYKTKPVGYCEFSDLTVFSFHPVKPITTAEGGLVTTRDDKLAARLRLYRSHGITREPELLEQTSPGGWYYEQQVLGFNYRLTDLQAALGLSQIQRLDHFITARNRLAKRYDEKLSSLPLTSLLQKNERKNGYHLYVIRVAAEKRDLLFSELRHAGIGVNVHYIPIPAQPYYRALGFDPTNYPGAQAYYSSVITLPLFTELSEAQQDEVVHQLERLL